MSIGVQEASVQPIDLMQYVASVFFAVQARPTVYIGQILDHGVLRWLHGRDPKLESRTARGGLKPSAKPYFRAIDEGIALGYRKGRPPENGSFGVMSGEPGL